ncbi:DUF4139 domain-containing protein [Mucilaginibacter sp.]
MFKKLLTIGLIFVTINSRADGVQKVTSKVQKVIVFLNGAQVTRTANVDIAAGESTLVFGGISSGIDEQSIQVHAGGDFTILSVKNELNFLNGESKQKDIDDLKAQQKILRDKLQLQENLLTINQQEEQMLFKNQMVIGQNSTFDAVKLKQALDFQTERLTGIKKKELDINNTINSINIELQKYDSQIYELRRPAGQVTRNILVTVSAKAATQTEFTLNYVVHNANWYPSYDIRAKNVNSPINIAYKANVSQRTGEDWKNIKLTLSTGNPIVSGNKPELSPYYLNLDGNDSETENGNIVSGVVTASDDGLPIPGVTVMVRGTSIGTQTNNNGHYSISVPGSNQTLVFSYIGYQQKQLRARGRVLNVNMSASSNELAEVVVTRALGNSDAKVTESDPVAVNTVENQTNVEFNIDNPYSIPSDGKQYAVEINQLELKADYQYTVAPKLSTNVFLTANLSDWNKYNLLSGEANIFFEGTYVGKTTLDANSTADTLNISLGTDKNIQVTRTLQKELTQRQSIGSNKKDTRDWLLEIRNRKKQPVNLLVEDQVPVSQNTAIEVENQQLSGGNLDTGTGKVTWKLKLSAQNDKKLELKYQVKYPKDQSITVE